MRVGRIHRLLDIMGVPMTVLAVHHRSHHGFRFQGAVKDIAMAGKTLHLLIGRVGLVQLGGRMALIIAKTVAVPADCLGHGILLEDLFLMAGVVAVGLIVDEVSMVDRDQTHLYLGIGYFVTVHAGGLHQTFAGRTALEKMTRETDVPVHFEVVVSYKMTMTGRTRYLDAVYGLEQVLFMGKFRTAVLNVVGLQFLH
jgi:hypothetical protein